jgi:hypothetical protein
MPVKNHPFFLPPAGAVFAIAIAPDRWGFVRFFRGLSMGVLSLVGDAPVMPDIDWSKPPIKWIFFSFAPRKDSTQAVALGVVSFENESAEWGPPCFDPPDVIESCYRIHERGMIRKPATAKDVEGMMQCRTVTPTQLAQFLRDRLEDGDLKPV